MRNNLLKVLFLFLFSEKRRGGERENHARKPTPTKPLDVWAKCLPKNTSLIKTSPRACSSKRKQMSLNVYLHSPGEKTRNSPWSHNCSNVIGLNIDVRNFHFKGHGTHSISRAAASPLTQQATFLEEAGRGGGEERLWKSVRLTFLRLRLL